MGAWRETEKEKRGGSGPCRNRTCNPLIKSQMLCLIELTARKDLISLGRIKDFSKSGRNWKWVSGFEFANSRQAAGARLFAILPVRGDRSPCRFSRWRVLRLELHEGRAAAAVREGRFRFLLMVGEGERSACTICGISQFHSGDDRYITFRKTKTATPASSTNSRLPESLLLLCCHFPASV